MIKLTVPYCWPTFVAVPGQPSKFQVGDVSDTSIELTWELAFDKEGIISYELRYTEGSFGSQVSISVMQGLRCMYFIIDDDPAAAADDDDEDNTFSH